MPMKWNRPLPESSRLPLWFQIAERLKTAIRRGEFKPGDILPSEAQLNEVFAISRATSRAALNELENDGLIVRRSGKGSIVLRSRVDQPAEESSNFAEDMRRRGFKASYRTQSAGRLRANHEVAEALEVKVNSSRLLLTASADGGRRADRAGDFLAGAAPLSQGEASDRRGTDRGIIVRLAFPQLRRHVRSRA